ncbi:isoprenylcysteine carboxylmethyltransferase family protein [Sulfurovum sp. XGS-02]|uniref:methyltransferase family protein n=1 Tax=Sulfurovum sp. XGS-02 TaxID=2925411 RepID=UPI002051C1BD|nr:isoprenylcysteine carboxylmethyltransferase family protein [Sulfurovum sp. XGS-02]UPT77520.1 isoprenylcysteine carboxylmethyltransferase family protein [Sulfurovum sp. XGS-02]
MHKHNPLKIWLNFFVRMTLFAVGLLWPAGTWQWWEAWVLVGLWSVYGLVTTMYLLRHDPALLAERLKLVPLHKEQKAWDKALMLLFFIAGIGLYLLPGFDVMRYAWSDPLPLWVRVIAMLVHIPSLALLFWVMHENTYLSQVVKIDKERGHEVITTGPYAVIRHPMYTVTIILLFAVPVALGSRFSLIISLFLTVLLIVRTYLEDRTLHAELEGYSEYAKQTVYRLIPGIW